MDARHGELLAWECETGRRLPMPADAILAIEDAGGCVDLLTGEVLDVAGDVFDTTVICEAWQVVAGCEVRA